MITFIYTSVRSLDAQTCVSYTFQEATYAFLRTLHLITFCVCADLSMIIKPLECLYNYSNYLNFGNWTMHILQTINSYKFCLHFCLRVYTFLRPSYAFLRHLCISQHIYYKPSVKAGIWADFSLWMSTVARVAPKMSAHYIIVAVNRYAKLLSLIAANEAPQVWYFPIVDPILDSVVLWKPPYVAINSKVSFRNNPFTLRSDQP